MRSGSRGEQVPRLDLNLLVSFHALMETESVTAAAELLGVGTQAASASLSRLRAVLGDPLLVRSGRGMRRTSVGEELRGPVEEALARLAGTLDDRRPFDAAVDNSSFTVLASDYVTLVMLRQAVPVLAQRAPNVTVSVRPVVTAFGERMRNGQADLVVLPQELAGNTRALSSRPLFVDRFVCVVGRDNDAVGDSIGMDQFRSMPSIAYDGGAIPSGAQKQLARLGLDRPADVTTRGFVTAALMVPGTEFMALLPERLARHVAERAPVRLVEPPFRPDPITETMFWTERTERNPAHRWLRSVLSEVADAMPPAGPFGAGAADR